MNRESHPFRDVEALLEGLHPTGLVEALLVDRAGLIHILRRSLTEFHEHRRLVAGTPAELQTAHEIKYWEEVLGWAKEQQGTDVVLMDRAR